MSRRQLQLGELQASWKNLMTIPPRRGEVLPNGLDDGVAGTKQWRSGVLLKQLGDECEESGRTIEDD